MMESQPESIMQATKKRYSISFLINNYNYGRFLADAITSVLNQDLEEDYEIIVVDDGSIDDSREVIAQFGNRITAILKPNGGQASAFNAGVAASSGEWICFLDADDVVRSDKAQMILQTAADHPAAEWIFHPLKPVHANLSPISVQDDLPPIAHPIDVRAAMQSGRLDYKKLPFPIPATSGMSIRRSHLERLFPLPESDGISVNDTYLQPATMGNAPGVFLAITLACQRYHGSNIYVSLKRHDGETKNHALKARIVLLAAYWLQRNFIRLTRFSYTLLALGIAEQWRSKLPLPESDQQKFQALCSTLSGLDRLFVYSKAIYVYLRS
jgi:glycosyltransferase involved in cell wall biosynthesis